MLVSRAGDWTSDLIDEPPTHVWVRGIPTVGVANVRRLFTKVVLVATGSGIGPVLGHLLDSVRSGPAGLGDEEPAHSPTATRSSTRSKPRSPTR